MRFLMLIHVDETADAGGPPDSLVEAIETFRADTTYGRWLDDGGLAASTDALWLRTDAGRVTHPDGPFAESKEVVGGFFVVESPSVGDMARWATAFADLHAEHWPGLAYTAQVRQIVDPTP